MVREDLLEKLACPACRAAVTPQDEVLVCCGCRRTYPVNGAVPVLLDEESQAALGGKRQVAENVRLRGRFERWPRLYRCIVRLRPPHPFLMLNAPRNRRRFSECVERLSPRPRILDIGSGITGKVNVAGISSAVQAGLIGLEIAPTPATSVVGDAHKLPFRDASLEGVLIQGVLEHVRDPLRVVAEIERVLRPGGVVYVDVPFIQHYHQDPEDYRRYTLPGLQQLFGAFEELDAGVSAGPASAAADVLTELPAVWCSHPVLYWGSKWLLGWLVLPIHWLDYLQARRPRAHTLAGALYYLGRKPPAN
jgi:SAM-dependent methyltransferase/uncharacterized protein YbaR (Trm112 family)